MTSLAIWTVGLATVMAAVGTSRLRTLTRSPAPLTHGWWHLALAAVIAAGLAPIVTTPALVPAVALVSAVWAGLCLIDLVELRLPDPLTLGGYVGWVALIIAAALATDVSPWRSVVAGVVTAGAYLVLAIIVPTGFGLGDVKLGLSTGAVLGWVSWRAVWLGAVYAFVVFAVVAVVALIARRVDRTTQLPFGPFLVVGAAIAVRLAP